MSIITSTLGYLLAAAFVATFAFAVGYVIAALLANLVCRGKDPVSRDVLFTVSLVVSTLAIVFAVPVPLLTSIGAALILTVAGSILVWRASQPWDDEIYDEAE